MPLISNILLIFLIIPYIIYSEEQFRTDPDHLDQYVNPQLFLISIKQVDGTADDIDNLDLTNLMQEWDEHMSDFQPDDFISFSVDPGQIEVFIISQSPIFHQTLEETVTKPTKIRGAYYTSIFSQSTIDFIMKDPDGVIVTSKGQKKESLFSVNVTKIGDYQFIFSNKRGNEQQEVGFALDIHNATNEHLQIHDLDPLDQKVANLQNGVMVINYLNDIYYETKFSAMRQEGGYNTLQKAHNSLLIFSIIETIAIIGVTSWQIFYIKRLLDNRRLI